MSPELTAFLAAHPDIEGLDALTCDLHGIIRGKRLPVSDMDKPFKAKMAMPGSTYLLDPTGENINPHGLGTDDGDPDYYCRAIPETLSPVPWSDKKLAQVLWTLEHADGSPYAYDPRQVLVKALQAFYERHGAKPMVAFELEFYLLDLEAAQDFQVKPATAPGAFGPDTAGQVYSIADLDKYQAFVDDVTASARMMDLPIGAASKEYAPGQFEINLDHVADCVRAADHAVLFRHVVRNVAKKHGYAATFMPKPVSDAAGSGMHIHMSMMNDAGENIFSPDIAGGADNLRHAIGGLMATASDAMLIFAPNINSYRRFQPGLFVPANVSWAENHRGAALRIPMSDNKARRIEHRIAGADGNPYLIMAALLAGVDHGLRHKSNPGPSLDQGNAGPDLPQTLMDAIQTMTPGNSLSDLVGDDYIRVYREAKRIEFQTLLSEVSEIERRWYMMID